MPAKITKTDIVVTIECTAEEAGFIRSLLGRTGGDICMGIYNDLADMAELVEFDLEPGEYTPTRRVRAS